MRQDTLTGRFTDRRLRLLNGAMAILHLGQGVAILVLSDSFSLPITTNFLRFDEPSQRLVPEPNTLFDLRLAPLVASFLLISAFAHTLVTLPRVHAWYARNLDRSINYIRWYEYALSASVMIVVIAMLAGMYDLPSLVMAFTLTAVMILCGLVMEVHNTPGDHVNWTSFHVGSLAGAIPWAMIALYLFAPGTRGPGDVPGFVYGIFFSLLVWYLLFPANMVLQYRRIGAWRDYRVGEIGYIVLSLTAKSALAWQTFAGTLTTPA
jgi:hypothetical protein